MSLGCPTRVNLWVPIFITLICLVVASAGAASDTDVALIKASEIGDVEAVTAIISRGVNVNAKYMVNDWTALFFASQNGHTEVVKVLLDNGADANCKTSNGGWTPLIVASQNGHTAVVKLLLEKGADVRAKASFGNRGIAVVEVGDDGKPVSKPEQVFVTALDQAKKNEHGDIVEILEKAMGTPQEEQIKVSQTQSLTISKNGNVRLGPSTEYEIIAKVAVGTEVIRLEQSDSWYKVKLSDEKVGWIHRSLVESPQKAIPERNTEQPMFVIPDIKPLFTEIEVAGTFTVSSKGAEGTAKVVNGGSFVKRTQFSGTTSADTKIEFVAGGLKITVPKGADITPQLFLLAPRGLCMFLTVGLIISVRMDTPLKVPRMRR